MHTRAQTLATILATTALLLAIGSATATASRSFSVVGGGRAVLAIAAGERAVTFEDGTTGTQFIQDLTLHGSLHSLISKTNGSLIGIVTRVSSGANCRSNLGVECSASALAPRWHIQLISFSGTLPRIASITFDLKEAEFLLRLGTTECLYRGDLRAFSNMSGEPPTTSSLTVDESRRLPLFRILREEFFRPCPREGRFRATFSLSASVSVRLH